MRYISAANLDQLQLLDQRLVPILVRNNKGNKTLTDGSKSVTTVLQLFNRDVYHRYFIKAENPTERTAINLAVPFFKYYLHIKSGNPDYNGMLMGSHTMIVNLMLFTQFCMRTLPHAELTPAEPPQPKMLSAAAKMFALTSMLTLSGSRRNVAEDIAVPTPPAVAVRQAEMDIHVAGLLIVFNLVLPWYIQEITNEYPSLWKTIATFLCAHPLHDGISANAIAYWTNIERLITMKCQIRAMISPFVLGQCRKVKAVLINQHL